MFPSGLQIPAMSLADPLGFPPRYRIMTTRIAILQFPGSNCDEDTVRAAAAAGADAYLVWHRESALRSPDAVIVPGGFAYGDYLRAGAIARCRRAG